MISFVLPVYNCFDKLSAKLPELIMQLDDAGILYEIIIVDDGSSNKIDISYCLNSQCKILVNDKNCGKGYSVKRGIMAACGEAIIFMDGDFPFEPEVIEHACSEIQSPEVDMIIGDRTLPGSSYKEAPFIRSAGSKIISFIVSRFVTPGYYDTQCGIKGFKREVAKDIFSKLTINGFSFDVEIIFIAIKRKYTIKKIEVKVVKQLSSNVKVIFHGFQMLINFFRIKINFSKGRYN